MRFGVWYDFRNPANWRQPYAQLYAESLEQASLVDRLGFHSIWVSEHHVTDEGYLPAVFPMLAALAAETDSVRLGTAILLAPFHHPIRFAEEAAVVDHLCDGRLELGVAAGYRVEEFAAFGIDPAERGTRTEELVQVARLAWTGEPFSFEGRHFCLRDVVVTPEPAQPEGPPLWIGGTSKAAARRAGRLGCNFMPNSFAPLEIYEVYRRELVEHGYDPADFTIATDRVIYVCDDPEQGWEDVKWHLLYQYNKYREWFAAAGDHLSTGPPLEDPDDIPVGLNVVGTPDMVIAELEAMRDRFAWDEVYFWARPPGLPIDKSTRSIELFAEHVLPHFRSSEHTAVVG